MTKFKFGLIPLALASMYTANSHADEFFDDRFYVAPMGSYVLADNDRHTKDAYGGTLAAGKRVLPYLEAEILGTYLHYGEKTTTTRGGLLGLGTTTTSNKETVYAGGVGVNILMAPNDQSFRKGLFIHADVQDGKKFLYNAGLGYDLPLNFTFGGMVSGIAIRAEALYHHQKGFEEPQFNLGVRIPFGAPPTPPVAAPEPPVAVVPAQEPPPPPPPPPCEMPQPGEPISMEGCKTGDTIVLRGVNFDFDKSTLTLNAKSLLNQVADALKSRPDIKVEIDGHTDGKGSVPYNLKLSDARAASVRSYLVEQGIDSGRMTSKGFGKSMPIADNATDAGRELNRRVELKVTEANGGAGAVEVAPMTSLQTSPDAPATSMPPAAEPASSAPMAPMAPSAAAGPMPAMDMPMSAPADTASAAPGGGNAVSIANFAFAPASITVAPGTTVTWTNADSSAHTVKFADEESGKLSEGASYSKTFSQPGSYAYKCGIHSSMTGTVIVK